MGRHLLILAVMLQFLLTETKYDSAKCGTSTLDGKSRQKRSRFDDWLENKAMGGKNAKSGEVDFNVLLKVTFDERNMSICGGTMISDRHLVTAAHCFKNMTNDRFTMQCSPTDLLDIDFIKSHTNISVGGICSDPGNDDCKQNQTGESNSVKRLEFYEQYFLRNCIGGYDIALIELHKPVNFSHACLAHRNTVLSEPYKVFSFGYGVNPLTGDREKYSNWLQTIHLGVPQNKSICAKRQHHFHDDAFICTNEENQKNVCDGDSGGGIIGRPEGRNFHLYGVVSYGTGCNDLLNGKYNPHAQINTDIRYFTATIDKFMGVEMNLTNIDHLPGEKLQWQLEELE